jgi:hypothetical protein
MAMRGKVLYVHSSYSCVFIASEVPRFLSRSHPNSHALFTGWKGRTHFEM